MALFSVLLVLRPRLKEQLALWDVRCSHGGGERGRELVERAGLSKLLLRYVVLQCIHIHLAEARHDQA